MICHTLKYSTAPAPLPPKDPHLLVCPGEVVFHSGWGSHHECPQRLPHQGVDAGDNEGSYRHGAHWVRQHPPWGWRVGVFYRGGPVSCVCVCA